MVTMQPTGEKTPTAPPATQVVVSQPKGAKVEWSTGLMDCTQDAVGCVLGAFCAGPMFCCLASRMGENCCVAFCQGGFWALRSAYRERHNIEGTMCSDYCTVACCPCLAVCQLSREMDHHGYPEKRCC